MNQNPLNTLRCPSCGRTYSDATQTFCLEDGNRLVGTSRENLQPTIAAAQPPPETVLYQPQVSGDLSGRPPAPATPPEFVPPWLPPSDSPSAADQSKAGRYSLIVGIASLAGPLLGLIGLIIRILNSLRLIRFEGVIGIGGLAGFVGLIVGITFGIAGYKMGRKALKKIQAGVASNGKLSAKLAVTFSLISIVLSISLFIMILFTINLAAARYRLLHW
jgi:hypothetical protein